MCGIAGLLDLTGRKAPDPAILRRMTAALAHRGPDDEGFHLEPPVGLGMRRLAINDVAHGGQPHRDESGDVRVVANGEIYNAPALRSFLEGRGHRLASRSDTEVLAHLYEEDGPDFVRRLHGMFAIALWDRRLGRLLLARDPMGIKPLYVGSFGGTFAFASELQGILAHPDAPRAVDPDALRQYLTWEYVLPPRSILRGIGKIPPATYVLADADGTVEVRYASLPDAAPEARPPTPQDAEHLYEVLRGAVRRHLASDVPLGVFLSGGVDSSGIVACLHDLGVSPIRTFSIGFREGSFDESAHARAVADHFGTEHYHATFTAEEALDSVSRLGDLLDEPMADPSLLPTHFLSRLARTGVTVALGGDGADELFAGYPTYGAHRWARRLRGVPRAAWRMAAWAAGRLPVSHGNMSLEFCLKRFLRGMSEPDAVRRHVAWMSPVSTLGRDLLAVPPEHPDPATAWIEPSAQPGLDDVEQAMRLNLSTYLPCDILAKVDRASMACALEVRVPYLDREFVEHVARLPLRWKLRGRTTKYLLRRALSGRVPEGVLRRPKKGFGIPLASWLCGPLRELAGDLLSPRRLAAQGLFRPDEVQRTLEEHWARRADHRKALWAVLAFQLWWEHRIRPAAMRARPAPAARHAAEPVAAGTAGACASSF